MAKHTGYFL